MFLLCLLFSGCRSLQTLANSNGLSPIEEANVYGNKGGIDTSNGNKGVASGTSNGSSNGNSSSNISSLHHPSIDLGGFYVLYDEAYEKEVASVSLTVPSNRQGGISTTIGGNGNIGFSSGTSKFL